MKRLVILISGRGSNMEALIAANLPARIAAVISNNPGASGLGTAKSKGLETAVINHRDYKDRESFDAALAERIEMYGPDLVVLAGFMRILTTGFISRFNGRILNIHPSLLPAYPGTDTHRRALADGVRLHGCTVHFVTPALDHGPIVVQAAVPVLPDDDESSLAARVLQQEHRIYPAAVRWFIEDRLTIDNGRVCVDGTADVAGSIVYPWVNQ